MLYENTVEQGIDRSQANGMAIAFITNRPRRDASRQ
jgi:hypothetical protein